MGSSLDLSWLMVHDGVIRRSDEEFSEMTSRGTSAIVGDLHCLLEASGKESGLICEEHVGPRECPWVSGLLVLERGRELHDRRCRTGYGGKVLEPNSLGANRTIFCWLRKMLRSRAA